MGNACCGSKDRALDKEAFENGMTICNRLSPLNQNSVRDNKFNFELFEKYELVTSCMNAHVGQSESFIYRLKEKYANAVTESEDFTADISDPKLLIVHSIITSNLTGFGPK